MEKEKLNLNELSEYDRIILKEAEDIIGKKDYSRLIAIMTGYDHFVKRWSELEGIPMNFDLPFWCCPFEAKEVGKNGKTD